MTVVHASRATRPAFAATLLVLLRVGVAGAQVRLIDAVKANDTATVRALLDKRVDVNAVEADGTTALHWAVYHQDPELVDQLLRAGAAADPANREGITPLQMAAMYGDAAIVSRLVKAGATALTRQSWRRWPLPCEAAGARPP